MLSLPDIGTAPRRIGARGGNPEVARLALTFAEDAPIARVRTEAGIEEAALRGQLEAWHARASRVLGALVCPVHLTVQRDDYSVWLGTDPEIERDPFGLEWVLETRWKALEAKAPGLAAAALLAIHRAGEHSLRVFTPPHAFDMASFTWWYGEDDESEVLAQWQDMRQREEHDAPPDDEIMPDGLVTRAQLDRVLPPAVTHPKPMKRAALQRLAKRRGEAGEIAAATVALIAAANAAAGIKGLPVFGVADPHCVYFAQTLRWNRRDGMERIFDDHVHERSECEAVERAYSLCIESDPKRLPRVLEAAERAFTLARQSMDLAAMIASRRR